LYNAAGFFLSFFMQTWALLSAVIWMLLLVFPLKVEVFWK